MKNKIASVYWIRLREHKDASSEGYVGVSQCVDARFKQHLTKIRDKAHANIHLTRAVEKYGEDNLVVNVLFSGEEVECYKMEEILRPGKDIGWNISPGGHKGPGWPKGRKRPSTEEQITLRLARQAEKKRLALEDREKKKEQKRIAKNKAEEEKRQRQQLRAQRKIEKDILDTKRAERRILLEAKRKLREQRYIEIQIEKEKKNHEKLERQIEKEKKNHEKLERRSSKKSLALAKSKQIDVNRKICSACNVRPVAHNYTDKNGKLHYRRVCDTCKTSGKKAKNVHSWMKAGYRKKPQCEKCGFKFKFDEQSAVFYLDGNLRNNNHFNLKTVCLNCCQEVYRSKLPWKQSSLPPDF